MVVDFHQSLCSDDGAGVGGDSGPELGALLGDGAGDGGALHLALGVDDDACVVFEVQEVALSPAEGLSLAHEDGGHDLLPEVGLALAHRAQEHVADGAAREAVQAAAGHGHGDHEQGLGARVVGAVDDGRGGQAGRNLHLGAAASSLSYTVTPQPLPLLLILVFLINNKRSLNCTFY